MNRLNSELRSKAVDLGLCAQWQERWSSDKSQQELIEMWKEGIDFGIAYQYPSNDFIKSNFDRDLLRRNHVFVDERIDLNDAPSGIYVINGNCSGDIRLAPWSVATIYLRHKSKVRIETGDFCRVFVRLYDDSNALTKAGAETTVKVYDRRG